MLFPMRKIIFELLPILGVIALALVCGYLLGRLVTTQSLPRAPIIIRASQSSLVPTVRIDGVRNGNLEGVALGGARFVMDGEPIVVDGSGSFRVPAGPFLTNMVTVTVPDGMQFVASRRGKKYYSVTSAQAAALAPANRIYFRTAEEAERAGYQK